MTAMIADVARNALETLGYAVEENDEALLQFCVQRAEDEICRECNRREVPGELEEFAGWLGCAEFLNAKLATGRLEGMEELNYGAVASIREGDVQVSYAVNEASTAEGRLAAFINGLRGEKERYAAHRRIKW